MNIVTPFPTTPVLNTANVSTESARRDNILRETIPQTANNDKGEAERGLGSESDRARQASGQFSSPLVYEKPTLQAPPEQQNTLNDQSQNNNGQDESAGRENAEQKQQEQAEQTELRDLKARDREVRAHEQAHAAVGGQYAGAPRYDFETGPDGQRYAVGGEVSIDISEESTPSETLRKMQQVRAAALAPADPSPQDLRVAAEAAQRAAEAQSDLVEESANALSDEDEPDPSTIPTPSLDEIVDGGQVSTPTRRLDNVELAKEDEEESLFTRRNATIQSFYQQTVTTPTAGFSATV